MDNRPTVVNEGGSGATAAGLFGILVVVILLGVGVFLWHPWITTSTTTRTFSQPANNTQPAANGAGSETKSTTTTTSAATP